MKNYLTIKSKLFASILVGMLGFSGPICAQSVSGSEHAQASVYANPLFITLLSIIILLLFFIGIIASVATNVSKFYATKTFTENKTGKSATLLLFIMLGAGNLHAAAPGSIPTRYIGGLDYGTFYLMLCIILVEIVVLLILIHTIKTLTATDKKLADVIEQKKPEQKVSPIIKSLTDAVDIDKESDILLDHDYDGIKELDNNLPPWWKVMFYLTIIWSLIYLIHYHISRTGDLQLGEYNKELKVAELQKAEYMKNAANNVDESNVKLLTAASELNAGKDLFISNCAACHGKAGEGTVGPNLTDDYWLHKGALTDIFKSIKYGWPDKGMKAWKEDLSPLQIAQLSSYIKSLKGTNPPNAKAPQGDLYTESAAVLVDSTAIQGADSLKQVGMDGLRKDSIGQVKK